MRGHPASPLPAAASSPSPSGEPRSGLTRLVGAVAAVTLCLFGVTMAATGASADGPESAPSTTTQRVSATDTVPDDTNDDLAQSTETAPDDSAADGTGPATGGEPTPPDALGDDPELDALADGCFGGDLLACDHLFLQSPVDSAYEEYGDTCGGRQEPSTENWCGLGVGDPDAPDTPGTGAPVAPGELGDDPALDQLAADCYSGDMQACDDLYWDSPIDSEYEAYGNTCGGRVPDGTLSCTDLADPVPGTGDVPVDTGDVPVETGDVPVDTGAPGGEIPAPTVEPTGLGDDPELDALAQECYDGTMSSCDDLYNASESGSAYEEYADTCAGRQPAGTGRYCVTSFPGAGTDTIPTDTVPQDTTPPTPSSPDTTTVFVPPPPTNPGSGPSLPPLPSAPVPTVPAASLPTTAPGTQTVPPVPTVAAPTVPPLPGATTAPAVVPAPTDAPISTVPGATPPATIDPTGLGTDPILDGLAQACFDGDMESCDQLWRDAEPGSDYRSYGDTCAGRQESGTARWCVVSFPGTPDTTVPPTSGPGSTGTVPVPTGTVPASSSAQVPPPGLEPTGLGDDAALDALAQACYDGDLASCDTLFDSAPFNSDYQEYGDTCAGRQAPGTFKYCVAAFPTPD